MMVGLAIAIFDKVFQDFLHKIFLHLKEFVRIEQYVHMSGTKVTMSKIRILFLIKIFSMS